MAISPASRRAAPALVALMAALAAAQTSAPAQPEVGSYACSTERIATDVFGKLSVQMGLSVIGTVTLDGKGRYKAPEFGASGQYRLDAKTGKLSFTGPLAALPASYKSSNGVAAISLLQGKITHTCVKSAQGGAQGQAAQSQPKAAKALNGGLKGTLVLEVNAARISAFDLQTGRASGVADGSYPQGTPAGLLAFVPAKADLLRPDIAVADKTGRYLNRYRSAIIETNGETLQPTLSPTGLRLAFFGVAEAAPPSDDPMADFAKALGSPEGCLYVVERGKSNDLKPQTCLKDGDSRQPLAWAPDGRLVYVDTSGRLRITDPSYTRSQVIVQESSRGPAVSPRGQLAFLRGAALFVSDLTGGNQRRVGEISDGAARVAFSPDSQAVAVTVRIELVGRYAVALVPLGGKPAVVATTADGERLEVSRPNVSWR